MRPRSSKMVNRFMERSEPVSKSPVNLAIRVAFNPNVTTGWFTSVMGIINNVTMLAIILAGAAVVREREHGTMDHLLVMPLTPFQIAMAKVWANGLIIAVAVFLSLEFVVQGLLHVPDQRLGAAVHAGRLPLPVFRDRDRHFPRDRRPDHASTRPSLHARCDTDEHPYTTASTRPAI